MGKKINKTELAAMLGVTQKTITSYQSQGLPFQSNERGKSNIYDTEEVIKWFIDREIARRYGDPGQATEKLDREYEQARYSKAQADGKEIENAIKRGELAPVDFLTDVLSHVASQIAAVLDSIPQKVKRRVPKLTASEVEIVKREIIKAQNAAARMDTNLEKLVEDFIRAKGGVKATRET